MGLPKESSPWRGHVALIAIAATLFRVPIWLTNVSQTFDEGVFLASNDLVASGLVPFRDFFSSQGPLFLPMLRLSQILSFNDPRGARTLMVVAGILVAISFYFIARTYTSGFRAMLFSLVLAASGVGILAAGPIQSEGLALGLATAGLAVLLSNTSRWSIPLTGILLGAAVAVKSLHVLPVILLVVLVYVARRAWRPLGATGLIAIGTLTLATVPFGPARVWDQYVLFHLAKDNTLPMGINALDGLQGLWRLDRPTVVIMVFVASFALALRRDPSPSAGSDSPKWLPWTWLVLTLPLIVAFTPVAPGFSRALIVVVPPILLILATIDRTPIQLLVGLTALALLWQPWAVDFIPGRDVSPEELAIIAEISDMAPDRRGVSDAPGLLWAAGVISSPATVDPSFARFRTGYLTNAEVEVALESEPTCVYVPISGRFDIEAIPIPPEYGPTITPGVFRRADC